MKNDLEKELQALVKLKRGDMTTVSSDDSGGVIFRGPRLLSRLAKEAPVFETKRDRKDFSRLIIRHGARGLIRLLALSESRYSHEDKDEEHQHQLTGLVLAKLADRYPESTNTSVYEGDKS